MCSQSLALRDRHCPIKRLPNVLVQLVSQILTWREVIGLLRVSPSWIGAARGQVHSRDLVVLDWHATTDWKACLAAPLAKMAQWTGKVLHLVIPYGKNWLRMQPIFSRLLRLEVFTDPHLNRDRWRSLLQQCPHLVSLRAGLHLDSVMSTDEDWSHSRRPWEEVVIRSSQNSRVRIPAATLRLFVNAALVNGVRILTATCTSRWTGPI